MNKNLQFLIERLQTQISPNPKNNMKRVNKAIKYFGLNFDNVKLIHVAGTNGKGSVCKYLTQILTDNHYQVGTFVSPYLIKFNERILINNKEISDNDLEIYIKKVLDYNKTLSEKMSFFELITVLTLIYFYDLNLDVIIMETGIGGLYDVTNVLNYQLSLLTNVGTDHLEKLGPTIEDVLINKVGILKKNGYLITTIDNYLIGAANNYANEVKGTIKHLKVPNKISDNPLRFKWDDTLFELRMLGDYQIANAILAIEGIKYLFPEITDKIIAKSLKITKWAGRLDIISSKPLVIVDAAHNKEAAVGLANNLLELYPNKKITVIMSILHGKDYQGFINEISRLNSQIILTAFPDPRLADLKSISKEFKNIKLIENFEEVLREIKDNNTVYVITGSIHFIGYFINHFK